MYFQNYTPPQTHLAPAETNPAFGAYELQWLWIGVVDEASHGRRITRRTSAWVLLAARS
jgi:hypothetical protein